MNKSQPKSAGFTMVEVLASMAVLVVLVLALTRMFVEAANITRRGSTMLMRNSTIETAMESILKDTESMVVNERLPCYIEANTVDDAGFGFDEAFFITTSGDQDDDRAYQLRRYYVQERVVTNSLGVPWKRYQLFRDVWIFAVADGPPSGTNPGKIPVDVMELGAKWWDATDTWGVERILLADNVVRFDIYCLGWDGQDWMGSSGALHVFDSTQGPNGLPQFRHTPPASFDIYLQVTSPEAALEGGMALVVGVDPAIQREARALMIRDSATMVGRASPVMGSAQLHHPARHYTDPL
jgi:prepilin-type N-terminal cleavage/methylation domain-containing protein